MNSVTDYQNELDKQSLEKYNLSTIGEYLASPETEALYDFIFNLHSAMRSIGCVHQRVGVDYKQYVIDILSPKNRMVLLWLVTRLPLEHSLATTFIAQQQERDPAERTRLLNRCLELVKEIEELSNGATKTTAD